MTTSLVIPPSTFRQIPGTDVDIAVEGDANMAMEVTGYQNLTGGSDGSGFRAEVTLKVGDTTITLRVPRGTTTWADV